MNESKIVLTERLRREGRWGEASRFKDEAVKDFRSNGMKRPAAGPQLHVLIAAWPAPPQANRALWWPWFGRRAKVAWSTSRLRRHRAPGRRDRRGRPSGKSPNPRG